jgi:hypothetical protein
VRVGAPIAPTLNLPLTTITTTKKEKEKKKKKVILIIIKLLVLHKRAKFMQQK